jgi:hypothetical protein
VRHRRGRSWEAVGHFWPEAVLNGHEFVVPVDKVGQVSRSAVPFENCNAEACDVVIEVSTRNVNCEIKVEDMVTLPRDLRAQGPRGDAIVLGFPVRLRSW